MNKLIMFVLCGSLGTLHAWAQHNSIDDVVGQIEQNNPELQALLQQTESQRLTLRSGNNLPDPEFGMYYMPFGDLPTGNYTEYEITQSFEFPTVYSRRNTLIEQQATQLELNYKIKRQEILTKARAYCFDLVYLNKQIDIEQVRLDQARTVYEHASTLFDKEEIGILELNKAKVVWMQDQFTLQQMESEKKNLQLRLTQLNGGNKVDYSAENYTLTVELAEKETLWQEKQQKDPAIAQLKQQEAMAQQSLKLAKSKMLPNLTAGFNSQGVPGGRASGFYAGTSIPIWSNRKKVKAAAAHIDFQEAHTSAMMTQAYAEFESDYNNYQIMLSKYMEYEKTLSQLNSEALLLKAYQLGEISFLEYYMELKFYRDAYDTMLKMQHELYQLQNEIMNYQL